MKTVRSSDGTLLAFDVYGAGQPLIYISGASCFRTFQPIIDDAKVFGVEFSVFVYDRRGRGESGDTHPYSIQREIEDIEAIIDAAGGAAFLYGHSSGAVLALEAALVLADKVQKVLVYDPPYVHSEEEREKFRNLSEVVLGLLSKGKNKGAMKKFLAGIGMPTIFVWLLPLFPGWKKCMLLRQHLPMTLN